MSGPWWGKDVAPAQAIEAFDNAVETEEADLAVARAQRMLAPLTETDRTKIVKAIDAKREGFTPTWTSRRPGEPGNALIDVYATQEGLVARSIGHLPTKARVEHLRAAGVTQVAPRPLSAWLVFEVSASASQSVIVGKGFEVMGRDAAGESVPFETDANLAATSAVLDQLGRRSGGTVSSLPLPGPDMTIVIHPFGQSPAIGNELYIGLKGDVAPTTSLSIGFFAAASAGPPPFVSTGGLFPAPGAEPPLLAWEIFDGNTFAPAAVVSDSTNSFTRTGIVVLRVQEGWRAGIPAETSVKDPEFWIRCRLRGGAWPTPPQLSYVALNVVDSKSGRTIRDEVVETPTTLDPAARRVLRLAERPVMKDTLDVRIDEGEPALTPWEAVADLAQSGADARAFRFDAAQGTLTFGDGRTGRPLPDGFRHVRATYRVAPPSKRVAAGAISTLVGSAPFLSSVSNPLPATGGQEVETLAEALGRGPRDIRARERAVAPADYETLAKRAAGSDVRRAFAVSGFHPRFQGRPIPGVVGVFVVGRERPDNQPPIPSEGALDEVSKFLSGSAPRGAEVIAIAPRFHLVRVEATVTLSANADITATLDELTKKLNEWFDPVIGGPEGGGWPVGGKIRHADIVRFVLRELGTKVTAVPRLLLVVDGIRSGNCEDVGISQYGLLWPTTHELVPEERRSP